MTRHRLAARLGVGGAALGVAAGAVQATVGHRIPAWTGAKQAPVSLGLLTIALSLLAGLLSIRQAGLRLTVGSRALCAFGLFAVALLCFSTVGRLWYLPGPVLLASATMTVDGGKDTALLIAGNWSRCLLGVLGAAELLMAAGASPIILAVGAAGGIALIAAARVAHVRAALVGLVLVGTVPFAALAWTAVVPIVLLLVALALTAQLVREGHPTSLTGADEPGERLGSGLVASRLAGHRPVVAARPPDRRGHSGRSAGLAGLDVPIDPTHPAARQ